MTVSPVKHDAFAPQSAPQAPKVSSPATAVQPKKDTLYLSEKAKDLAAQIAGKGFAEEAKESPTAKAMEGE